jgi:hypothetical protein
MKMADLGTVSHILRSLCAILFGIKISSCLIFFISRRLSD